MQPLGCMYPGRLLSPHQPLPELFGAESLESLAELGLVSNSGLPFLGAESKQAFSLASFCIDWIGASPL